MSESKTGVNSPPGTGRLRAKLMLAGLSLALVAVSTPVAVTAPNAPPAVADGSPWMASFGDWWPSDPRADYGSLFSVNSMIGSEVYWRRGFHGTGVGVAVIDTGVTPVNGLTGRVIHGLDVSLESQDANLRHLDTNGHGTHLAGIIATRPDGARLPKRLSQREVFGVAPGAHIISVKAGNADGAVDVSQVIAAIDWVVQHRNDPGLNIRVLNLSFGTKSVQDSLVDPLSHAVEQAWRHGIVVIVAGGNDGNGNPLRMPAMNGRVLAVGAVEQDPTAGPSSVAAFSNCDPTRSVDLLAPGYSIASLRVPGSYIDVNHPNARMGDNLFRGSGTSQAAAVVSGAVALVIQQRPNATPDQVKHLMMSTAAHVQDANPECVGAGGVDLQRAFRSPTPTSTDRSAPSRGTGSLEAARGGSHLSLDSVPLTGEQDIFGRSWNGTDWAAASSAGAAWSGGVWNSSTWSGDTWSNTSWSGLSWSGLSWSGVSWSGVSWSGVSWSGVSWSGMTWNGVSWSGSGWGD